MSDDGEKKDEKPKKEKREGSGPSKTLRRKKKMGPIGVQKLPTGASNMHCCYGLPYLPSHSTLTSPHIATPPIQSFLRQNANCVC